MCDHGFPNPSAPMMSSLSAVLLKLAWVLIGNAGGISGLHVCFGFANKLRIKMTGACKDDIPPSCAIFVRIFPSIGVKDA